MTRGSWLGEHLVGHYQDFVGLFNTCTPARCVEWQGVCNMVKFGMREKIRNHSHLKMKKERRDLTNNAGQCPANKSSAAEFSTVPGRRALFCSSIASTKLQSSSQILKHLCDFSLPNVDLGLQSFQCSKIRSAQHWGRRVAYLSENKGVKHECKKFG